MIAETVAAIKKHPVMVAFTLSVLLTEKVILVLPSIMEGSIVFFILGILLVVNVM
jgi:hypothetical protein